MTPSAQPKDAQLLAHKAEKALWDALRTGRLRDGQFLSIAQLVEILDCPIAATREAVKQASSHGLLSTLPKRGVQVMEAKPETIRDCLDYRMVLDQEGARRRIATGAFDGLQDLRDRHVEMQVAARDDPGKDLPPRAIEVDLSLHNFLVEGLGNARLTDSYDANRMRVAIIQNARPFLQDRVASAMNEHLAIIDALESRDAEAAVAALQYHCEQTQRWWGVV